MAGVFALGIGMVFWWVIVPNMRGQWHWVGWVIAAPFIYILWAAAQWQFWVVAACSFILFGGLN